MTTSHIFSIAEGAIAESPQSYSTPISPDVNTPVVVSEPIQKYVSLITSEFKTDKFLQLVKLITDAIDSNTTLISNLEFNVNTSTGFLLDYIGEWVGVSRFVTTAITDVFFSFDIEELGFDLGYWNNQYSSTTMTILPDDLYRKVIIAKIYANTWNGSIPDAEFALSQVFGADVIIQDNQDMTMSIGIMSATTPIIKTLLTQGYFDLRPSGVELSYVANTVFFGFDLDTTIIKGFDAGYWTSHI